MWEQNVQLFLIIIILHGLLIFLEQGLCPIDHQTGQGEYLNPSLVNGGNIWSFVYDHIHLLSLELVLDSCPMAPICFVNESPLTHLRHDSLYQPFKRSKNKQLCASNRRLLESWQRSHAVQQTPRQQMAPIKIEKQNIEVA